MAQSIKGLPYRPEDLSSSPRHLFKILPMTGVGAESQTDRSLKFISQIDELQALSQISKVI